MAQSKAEQVLYNSAPEFISVLNSIGEAFALYDDTDRLVFFNHAYLDHHSPKLQSILKPGLLFSDLIRAVALTAADDGLLDTSGVDAFIGQQIFQHAHPGTPFETSRNGRWYRYREQSTEDGGTMVIITDVNDLKKREIELTEHRTKLQLSHDRFRHVFEHAPIGIWEEDWSALKPVIDKLRASGEKSFARYFLDHPQQVKDLIRQIKILEVNTAVVRIYRAPGKLKFFNMINDPFWINAQIPSFTKLLTQLAGGSTRFAVTGRERCFDGTELYISSTVAIAEAHQHNWTRVVHTTEDISETRKLTRQLSFHATHDALTGLINRSEFERRLLRVLDTARETGTSHALCYMDLDQFKVINDNCSHGAGDELLRRLPECIQPHIRVRDTLARLGGDEFAILMEHCTMTDALRVAESVRKAIDDFLFDWQGQNFRISTSIGLVVINEESCDLSATLSAADVACYAAKDAGRNRIHVYSESNVQLQQYRGAMHWVTRIRQALDKNHFVLVSQAIAPLVPSAQGGDHYEILIRMLALDGHLVPPGEFLPVAERFQLATAVDRWVVKSSLAWLCEDPCRLEQTSFCSINLSGQSLGDEDFAGYVCAQFSVYKIPYDKICFEITETAMIGNLDGARNFISTLRELGCKFALDDFGSGLSSFAYLKTLAVDIVKIDGMFVRSMDKDPIDHAMVKSINDLAHLMGKQTVAEFVESDAIVDCLKEIGVDYLQGYAIGKPQVLAARADDRKLAG